MLLCVFECFQTFRHLLDDDLVEFLVIGSVLGHSDQEWLAEEVRRRVAGASLLLPEVDGHHHRLAVLSVGCGYLVPVMIQNKLKTMAIEN